MKNSFATLVNVLSVLKLFQLSNGNLLFSKHDYSLYKARKPRMTKLGQGVGVRAHYPTEYWLNKWTNGKFKSNLKLSNSARGITWELFGGPNFERKIMSPPPPTNLMRNLYHLISSFGVQKSYHSKPKTSDIKSQGAALHPPPKSPGGGGPGGGDKRHAPNGTRLSSACHTEKFTPGCTLL